MDTENYNLVALNLVYIIMQDRRTRSGWSSFNLTNLHTIVHLICFNLINLDTVSTVSPVST